MNTQCLKLIMHIGLIIICTTLSIDFKNTLYAQNTIKTSVYSDSFDGRKTASGEVYKESNLTAAHRTFEFGKKIKLTNPNNGRTVSLLINDRGPYFKASTLEISASAARKLGVSKDGIHDLVLYNPNQNITAQAKSVSGNPKFESSGTPLSKPSDYVGISLFDIESSGYALQIASLSSMSQVQMALAELYQKGYQNTLIRQDKHRFKVAIGPFTSKQEAEKAKTALGKSYLDSFVFKL